MGIIMLGSSLIAPPEGVDPTNMESIAQNIHLYGPQHFAVPFLAHALGTLFGAFIVAKLAASRQMVLAMVIGVFNLVGGIAASTMIPAPTWFIALDLVVAYIPMAYLGGKLGNK